jgi:hypothetical protein
MCVIENVLITLHKLFKLIGQTAAGVGLNPGNQWNGHKHRWHVRLTGGIRAYGAHRGV